MTVATVVADSACREARAVSNYRAGEARRAAVSRGKITRRQAGAGAESPRAAEGSAGVSGRRRPSKYRYCAGATLKVGWARSNTRWARGGQVAAVGTDLPFRVGAERPSFSDGGRNPFRQDRSPFQRKKEGYWRERGPRGRFHPYEPPREPSLHGQDAGG